MNKALLIAMALVVLIGGGIGFAMMNRTTIPSPETNTPTGDGVNPVMEVRSLRDLLTAGENQTCTFTDTTTANNGVVYITNGSMRGDFTTLVNGAGTNSHMVVVDDTFYVWTDGQTNGFKASAEQFNNPNSPSNTPETIDINQQVDYNCTPWAVDTAKFTVPTSIEFMDMTSLMESMPTTDPSMDESMGQGTNPGASNQCAACNNLSGDAKAQCLQALNCN